MTGLVVGQADHGGEQEIRTPDAEKQGDEGLGGLFVEDAGETALGQAVVVEEIGKNEDGQSNDEAPQGQLIEFLSHENAFFANG